MQDDTMVMEKPSVKKAPREPRNGVDTPTSAFVQRFTNLMGVPPIRYMTLWRLQAAKSQLRESQKTIGQLAYSVGYESEEAFSRAFKREFGLPPARWRDQQDAR